MATVREITTLFNFKPNLGGLNKSIISVDKLKAGLKRLGVGVVAAGAAIFALAKTTANYGDNIAKTSQKIGLSTDALQELIFAAGLAGVEQTTLEGAIKRLSRGMLEASQGVAEYADTYKDLDIDVEDANGKLKASDVIMEELADKLALMEDGTKKTALAQELFGRAGAELIPLLNSGSKGIKKMRKEARDLGLVMSKQATKASEDFNDELSRTMQVVLALKRRIGIALLPMIQKLSKAFRGWVSVNRELIAQKLNKVLKVIAGALGLVAGFLLGIAGLFFKFQEALDDGAASAIFLRDALLLLAAPAIISAIVKLGGALKTALSPLTLILKNPLVAAGGALFALLAAEVEIFSNALDKGIFKKAGDANFAIKKLEQGLKDLTRTEKDRMNNSERIKEVEETLFNLRKKAKELADKPGATVGAITTPASISKSSGQLASGNSTVNIGTIKVDASSITNNEKLGEVMAKKIEDISIKLRNKVNPAKEALGTI